MGFHTNYGFKVDFIFQRIYGLKGVCVEIINHRLGNKEKDIIGFSIKSLKFSQFYSISLQQVTFIETLLFSARKIWISHFDPGLITGLLVNQVLRISGGSFEH